MPFQPKMVNNVTKAYSDNKARIPNRTAGGRIQDVSNLCVGSNGPVYDAVNRFQTAMVINIARDTWRSMTTGMLNGACVNAPRETANVVVRV